MPSNSVICCPHRTGCLRRWSAAPCSPPKTVAHAGVIMNFAEYSFRDCPKRLGGPCNVALRAAQTALFDPFWPPCTRQIHARSVASTLFGQSLRNCLENSRRRLTAPLRRQEAPESRLLRPLLAALRAPFRDLSRISKQFLRRILRSSHRAWSRGIMLVVERDDPPKGKRVGKEEPLYVGREQGPSPPLG
jgi:hypothetical protein